MLRLWWLFSAPSLNADEAVAGLMIQHVAAGRGHPLFFYGQAYFGALDAYLAAPVAALVGWRWWIPFVVPLAASLVIVPLASVLADRLAGRDADLPAALLVAVPGSNLLQTMLLGGGFALAAALQLGLLAFLVWSPLARRAGWPIACLWAGLLLWEWQLWLAALPLAAAWAVRRFRPGGAATALGAALLLIGALPLLWQNIVEPWSTFWSLAPRLGIFRGIAPEEWLLRASAVAGNPGIDFAGEALAGLAGGNPMLAATSVAAVIWWAWRLLAQRGAWSERERAGAFLLAVALATWLAGASQQRYLLTPAVVLGALLAAALAHLDPPAARRAVVAVLLVANVATYPLAERRGLEPVAPSRELADTLLERGLARGYADYWTAYPATYLSAERVILAPALRDPTGVLLDRYPAYRAAVDAEPAAVCIVDPLSPDVPGLRAAAERGECSALEPLGRWWVSVCQGGSGPCGLGAGR